MRKVINEITPLLKKNAVSNDVMLKRVTPNTGRGVVAMDLLKKGQQTKTWLPIHSYGCFSK